MGNIFNDIRKQVERLDHEFQPDSIEGKEDSFIKPKEIRSNTTPVLSITPEMIPYPIRGWVVDISERLSVPLEFTAMAAICSLASIIGTSCAIKPKKLDNWTVIPNVWGGIVSGPSTMKTPVFNEIQKPFNKLELEHLEKFKAQQATYQAEQEVRNLTANAIKQSLKTAIKDGSNVDVLQKELSKLNTETQRRPIQRRYKASDVTPEKLADLLVENPRGLLVFKDELIGLLNTFEKTGYEQFKAFLLSSWTGIGLEPIDRIGRGTSFVENPCLSIFGGIQPDKLSTYLMQVMKGDNDGFMQRFQLLVYPDHKVKSGEESWVDRRPDHAAMERAYGVINKLDRIEYISIGANKGQFDSFPYFKFDDEAQQVFKDWYISLEEKIRNEENSLLAQHFSKYRSLMPSLALVFHIINLADGAEDEGGVSLSPTQQALQWCDVLETHARRVYTDLISNTQNSPVNTLAKYIEQKKLNSPFTRKDIELKGWGIFKINGIANRGLIDDTLEELVCLGWVKRIIQKNTNGRPGLPKYYINPMLPTKPS